MNPQEVLTVAQYEQTITWIIFNNGGLGLVELAQQKQEPYSLGVRFSKVSYQKLAEAFGLVGEIADHNTDLYALLKKVKNRNKPTIIDVFVEYPVKL